MSKIPSYPAGRRRGLPAAVGGLVVRAGQAPDLQHDGQRAFGLLLAGRRTSRSVGDLALVRPPPALARWMAIRGYLPLNVPLIKHVAAVGGQWVCGRGGVIRIDGRVVATC
jgi:type IV secretory pathway protease TraF